MQGIFEFLFKYRPLVFEQGEFAFAAPLSVRTWLIVVGLIAAGAVATYTIARGKSSVVDRGVMAALRVGLLAVLVFCLMQPALTLSTVVPQQNFVGILMDDSRSMQLADEDGTVRSSFFAEQFTRGESPLIQALSERFVLRFFRFSDVARRVDGLEEMTFDGTHTNIANALDVARGELSGVPLSGLVVVTDGADTGERPLTEAIVPLQAAGVPVFTVGLGDETLEPDIELGRVELPRTALQGSTLMVDVVVTQSGFSRGSTVPVIVEDDTRILAEESVELGPAGEPVVTRIGIELQEPGARRVRFRIPGQPGERVERNNARNAWIDVVGESEKILYFEGEPRWEVKFMRRAVADDENLQLVLLQRTAESKFLRLEVSDSTELEFGFPTTRQELYRYRALVIGSVEASFFTFDQLQMIADFVSERGGGLLFLGGLSSFAEGGWAGTPVEEVMPVILGPPAGEEGYFSEIDVTPTPAGFAHPAVQLDAEPADLRTRWEALPPLTVVNPINAVRPGATVLLTGSRSEGGEQIVLSYQRYGRGTSIALTAQDTWLWQMHSDVTLEDQSHESFWKQMLRWLVDGVPNPVLAVAGEEEVEPGESVELTASVRDSTFLDVNDATVTATVTSPSGLVEEVPLEWTVEEDGQYAAPFRPLELGDYEIQINAQRQEASLGTDVTYLHSAPSDREFFGAARRTQLLRRIADDTGGQFYTRDNVATLPEDITISGAGVTLVDELDLWDMPALFLLMLLLMGAEWGYRRIRGLV
ncbi:MAG: glutamine amidotransferase [Gemmatimonadota bacterium]|nr:glutamine amidotransferase [Gemmatimonadota bacterium]MDH3423054.1 glutamine amidotransferase [Gemmatimonadota bacterium]